MTDQHFAILSEDGEPSRGEGVTLLVLRGEFDLAAHGSLRAALTDPGLAATVVVDLAQASLIDAATVGLLLEARIAAAGQGRALYVVGAAGVVHRVLNILDPTQMLICGA